MIVTNFAHEALPCVAKDMEAPRQRAAAYRMRRTDTEAIGQGSFRWPSSPTFHSRRHCRAELPSGPSRCPRRCRGLAGRRHAGLSAPTRTFAAVLAVAVRLDCGPAGDARGWRSPCRSCRLRAVDDACGAFAGIAGLSAPIRTFRALRSRSCDSGRLTQRACERCPRKVEFRDCLYIDLLTVNGADRASYARMVRCQKSV